jgi:hypothetical protein
VEPGRPEGWNGTCFCWFFWSWNGTLKYRNWVFHFFFFQKLGGKWLIHSQHSSWLWGFPEMGVPLNHPFIDRFSIIKQPILGVPSILGAPPYYHSDTMTRHTATLLEVMRFHSRCLVEVWI